MDQWLRTAVALPEGPNSTTSTHMMAHNHYITPVAGGLNAFFWHMRIPGIHVVLKQASRKKTFSLSGMQPRSAQTTDETMGSG